MKKVILIHYHEISLKRNNRNWFESRLHRHVRALLSDIPHAGIERSSGRMLIRLQPQSPVAQITERLRGTFGIANFAVAREVPADIQAIRSAVSELAMERPFGSFRISARRGTKNFPMNSQQINEDLGRLVQDLTGAAVRLEASEFVIHVEIAGASCYLYLEKIPGGGGLPAGTGGSVTCLMSGGIDSPVAAYRMMRRGCRVHFVHFHSFPHTTLESQEKVRRILAVLARYQLRCKVHFVPFADLQREIVAYAPPPLRILLYRRFMLRIAEALALKEKSLGLVTGDSLGQVASQTLENLRVTSAVAALPVFRPLIGSDKEEIVQSARAIGTYEISILPDEDCCTMFVPKHPEIMARTDQVEKAESALDVTRLVHSCLDAAVKETIRPGFASAPPGSL
ncbi:MAG: tRNA 4-thiouridine(8) synthase ThiI [Acidobacteria bacterium]|nr:tRNA 4-thiouridine(8) synthase ThiI [Acidobacteriota bacterium]